MPVGARFPKVHLLAIGVHADFPQSSPLEIAAEVDRKVPR